MVDVQEVIQELSAIKEDSDVPKNIRERIREMILSLNSDGEDFQLKVDKTIQNLDDISNDPNLPSFTRTQIWGVMSSMESEFLKQ